MSDPRIVVDAVRACIRTRMRERGWTYRDLADEVGVAEVTIKRWMTADDLSIGRIGRIADALGSTAFELLRLAEVGQEESFSVSEEVEEALAADRDAHLAWDALRLGRAPELVRMNYGHEPQAWFRLLGRLEDLGLVQRHPEGRVRLTHRGIHNWRHEGPLQLRYRELHLDWVRAVMERREVAVWQSATRAVAADFYGEAEVELRALARRWRDRAWRDQVTVPAEGQRRVRWMLVLSEAPDWPDA